MIIGITGTNGAGKGEVVNILKEQGFAHYSVREFLSAEVCRRGLSEDRDMLIDLGNELRALYGAGYLVESLAKEAAATGGDAIIESIRTLGEVEALKRLPDSLLLAVDADRLIRYERIAARGTSTDHISFDKFVAQEEREMHSDDPAQQNIPAVISRADIRIENDGSLAQLREIVADRLKTALT